MMMEKKGKVSAKAKKSAPKRLVKPVRKPVKKTAPANKKPAKKVESSAKNIKTNKKAPVKKAVLAKGKMLPAKKPAAPVVKKTESPKVAAHSKKTQIQVTPVKTVAPKATSKSVPSTRMLPPVVQAKFPEFKGKKKKYYELLLALREQISGQMKFLSGEALDGQSSGLAGSISNHMADYGSDNFLHDMELEMITDEGEVIEMIDEAIQRLNAGDYGKCIECGCTIPDERLEVKPYAKFCVKCKSIHEENGDITL